MAKSSNRKSQSAPKWNYEATVALVEDIIARMEAGNLELDEAFDQFTLAIEYLKECDTFLAQKREQMDIAIETLTDSPEF